MRDWNEEYQVVRQFPAVDVLQRAHKERAAQKVYTDFLQAAIAGAQAIIEGKLASLNPNEPAKQHVFVYNGIFFSYAIDLPTSYRDLTSSDQFPSYTQANHDLNGLRQLQAQTDVQDLFNLATCLVQYKGHRMICQSIIPGILNNNDLSKLAEYGTVDDKKNIVASEPFHELMKQLAEALSIKVNKVLDPVSGKSIEIAGSIEVKGIKGSDSRYYLVDLQGLVPRDANFKGDDNHSCLLRHELVANYQKHKQLEYAQLHMKEFAKKLEEDRDPELKPEEGKELTEEQKKRYIEARQVEHDKQLKELERLMTEAPSFKFNVNVFKESIKLDMKPEELEAEEK